MKNTTVEYVLDPMMDKAELENVTPKNMAKVGLAIARRRLAKLNLVPYPIAITA
jgi:hypothetical protein